MATIGQALTSPESGWVRFNNTDANITYVNGDTAWAHSTVAASSGYYSNDFSSFTGSQTDKGYIKFNFTGTRIRLIVRTATTLPNDNKITIDNEEETFSTYRSVNLSQTLVYEKTGLENKEHFVTIVNGNGSILFDAIDIDTSGILKPYNTPKVNKILISLNDKAYTIKGGDTFSAIPIMTSNTTPSGVASASAEESPAVLAWRAFDGKVDNYIWYTGPSKPTGWINYEFTQRCKIKRYSIVVPYKDNSPKDFTFEGSNDGVNWDVIHTVLGKNDWIMNTETLFETNNDIEFKNYRINIAITVGGIPIAISEIKMYAENPLKLIEVKDTSEETFLEHGMNSSTEIDLAKEVTVRTLAPSVTTVLGLGRVFKRTIDTSKIPIKKVSIE